MSDHRQRAAKLSQAAEMLRGVVASHQTELAGSEVPSCSTLFAAKAALQAAIATDQAALAEVEQLIFIHCTA